MLTQQELLKLLDDAFEQEIKIVCVLLLNLSNFTLPPFDDDEHHTSLSIGVSNSFKECCLYFQVKINVIDVLFPHVDLAQCMQDMFALKTRLDYLQELVSPQGEQCVILTQNKNPSSRKRKCPNCKFNVPCDLIKVS